jgi:hypothetical protein
MRVNKIARLGTYERLVNTRHGGGDLALHGRII